MKLRAVLLTTSTAVAATAAVALPTAATASPEVGCGTVKTAQGALRASTFGAGANCRTARRIIKAVVTTDGYRRTYGGWTCTAYKKHLNCAASGARNADTKLRRTTAQ